VQRSPKPKKNQVEEGAESESTLETKPVKAAATRTPKGKIAIPIEEPVYVETPK